MPDVTLFTPSRYDRTRQYRARREMYAYLRTRWDSPRFDPSIEPQTGILVLDMRKSYRLGDVVDFNCFLYDQKPACNEA